MRCMGWFLLKEDCQPAILAEIKIFRFRNATNSIFFSVIILILAFKYVMLYKGQMSCSGSLKFKEGLSGRNVIQCIAYWEPKRHIFDCSLSLLSTVIFTIRFHYKSKDLIDGAMVGEVSGFIRARGKRLMRLPF